MVKENRAGAVAVILRYAHFWGHEGMSNIKGEFNFFFLSIVGRWELTS